VGVQRHAGRMTLGGRRIKPQDLTSRVRIGRVRRPGGARIGT
jgi:hypothetical protein